MRLLRLALIPPFHVSTLALRFSILCVSVICKSIRSTSLQTDGDSVSTFGMLAHHTDSRVETHQIFTTSFKVSLCPNSKRNLFFISYKGGKSYIAPVQSFSVMDVDG